MLKDAQAHPENYKDLLVRVAGYSTQFVNLSKSMQDSIMARNAHESFWHLHKIPFHSPLLFKKDIGALPQPSQGTLSLDPFSAKLHFADSSNKNGTCTVFLNFCLLQNRLRVKLPASAIFYPISTWRDASVLFCAGCVPCAV